MLSLLLSLASAAAAASFSWGGAQTMDPAVRDTQCLVALQAERPTAELGERATQFFDKRVGSIPDPELRELLMISADEAISTNTNRAKIAANCELLYQVLKLQEDRAKTGGASRSAEPPTLKGPTEADKGQPAGKGE
jgi:hypothetical protein